MTTETKKMETQKQVVVPAFDIQETEDGVRVLLDMPGVAQEQLDIQLEKQQVFIKGTIALEKEEGMTLLFNEFSATEYQQTLNLSPEIDIEKISASFQSGVLILDLPKKAALKPRKIEVKVS